MRKLKTRFGAVGWSLMAAFVVASGCGDDDGGNMVFGGAGGAGGPGAAGASGGAGRVPSQCVSAQLASGVQLHVAASLCVGLPLAAQKNADFRCDALPNPQVTGLVACVMPELDVAYVVHWRSTIDGEAVEGDNEFVAAIRRADTNTNIFALEYADGTRARCRISPRQLDFCLRLD